MRFGVVALDEAEGAMLAHATDIGEVRLRKAHRLTARDVAELKRAGLTSVIAAVLAPDDVDEDTAATRIVRAMRTTGVSAKPASTGRVNLHADSAGVFRVDRAFVDAVNAVDPTVTIATLADYAAVDAGAMIATIKIIPFGVSGDIVDTVESLCRGPEAFRVAPFRASRIAMVQTQLPTVKESVLDKTVRVTEARLARSGSDIVAERRVAHEAEALAPALSPMVREADMVLVFGASAMSDFDDVIPSAIRMAGGRVLRAGMPVDPGNLMVLGEIEGKPVIGAPGCARSPKENGFDWVLDRLLAGMDVTAGDIAGMGVGGLLMEIPSRPQPREALAMAKSREPSVEIVLLAAGRSSRMGGPNKLLALFGDVPLVRQTAQRASSSKARRTVVVTGHQAERIKTQLTGIDVGLVHNEAFATGLASSLKAGIAAVSPATSGAMILLGDMPDISTADIDRLIATFVVDKGRSVVRATFRGKRGNPVILPRALFTAVAQLEGDTGARHIAEAHGVSVIDVEIGEGAFVDVDTPSAMAAAGGVLQD